MLTDLNAVAAVDLAEDEMASARVRGRLNALWQLMRPHANASEVAFGLRLQTTTV